MHKSERRCVMNAAGHAWKPHGLERQQHATYRQCTGGTCTHRTTSAALAGPGRPRAAQHTDRSGSRHMDSGRKAAVVGQEPRGLVFPNEANHSTTLSGAQPPGGTGRGAEPAPSCWCKCSRVSTLAQCTLHPAVRADPPGCRRLRNASCGSTLAHSQL